MFIRWRHADPRINHEQTDIRFQNCSFRLRPHAAFQTVDIGDFQTGGIYHIE